MMLLISRTVVLFQLSVLGTKTKLSWYGSLVLKLFLSPLELFVKACAIMFLEVRAHSL